MRPPASIPPGHPDEALSAYVDGELTMAEMETVATHLAACGECRGVLQEVDAARAAVRALPRLDLPPASAAGPTVEDRRIGRRLMGVGVATAAGLAAAVAGFVLVRGPTPVTIDPGDLASRHVVRSAVDPGLSLPVVERPGGGR